MSGSVDRSKRKSLHQPAVAFAAFPDMPRTVIVHLAVRDSDFASEEAA